MTALPSVSHTPRPARRWAAGAVLAVVAAACSLAAGCSSGGASSGSSAAGSAPMPAAAKAGSMGLPGQPPAPSRPGRLLSLPAPGGQAIIYTARMTVRARSVTRAAAQAAKMAAAAGGYVSGESTRLDPAHPARSTVSIDLKIPAGAYQPTLDALSSQLGARLSLSEHAQDVTQAVADVTSRVASARAAIAQLRKLLARAGSVGSLLNVQNEINSQESNLEALLAQQRALAHETAYATVSLLLVSPKAAAVRHPAARAAGFVAGLGAGWRALLLAGSWLLTVLGAALPFLGPLAVLAVLGYLARRRLARRRPGPSAAE